MGKSNIQQIIKKLLEDLNHCEEEISSQCHIDDCAITGHGNYLYNIIDEIRDFVIKNNDIPTILVKNSGEWFPPSLNDWVDYWIDIEEADIVI